MHALQNAKYRKTEEIASFWYASWINFKHKPELRMDCEQAIIAQMSI
jgi:hypothetical protein